MTPAPPSEAMIKKHLDQFNIDCGYFYLFLHQGAKRATTTVECLIYAGSMHNLLANELDYMRSPDSTRTWVNLEFDTKTLFPHFTNGREAIYSIGGDDKGGDSDKGAVRDQPAHPNLT